jgi:L-cystine transport system permease protein
MDFDFFFLLKALRAAVYAVPRSLLLAACGVALGLCAGIPLALVRFYRVRAAAPAAAFVITVTKGVPNILLFFIFFAVFSALGGGSPELIAVLGIMVGAGTESSEAFRGALESVEKSQFDAAYSLGHTPAETFFRVVLPQALPVCVPMASGVVIHAIKALPVAMIIGLGDILNAALQEAVINYRYLESYIAAALVFWAIFILVEKGFFLLEKKYRM